MELDIPESIRSLLLLTNPGSRRAKEIHRELESRVAEIAGSCQVIWRDIFSPPDQELAVDRAVIVGGDGTVNLGLKWLQEAGVAAPVALIPAGTGNNLARGLGLPVKASDAIRIAATIHQKWVSRFMIATAAKTESRLKRMFMPTR